MIDVIGSHLLMFIVLKPPKPKRLDTPHSSKSQERYRWCAVGQAILESAHDPQDAGQLEIHGRRAGCGEEITRRKAARPMGSRLDS